MEILLGITIPFIGTSIGASMVFFMKDTLNIKIEKLLLGFASGVMIAASIWSLLIPAIEMAEEQGKISWIPAVIGFVLGILFLLLVDLFIQKFENEEIYEKNNKLEEKSLKENIENRKINKPFELNKQNIKSKIKDLTMLVMSVTLHNIPEGMAVGVVFAGLLAGNSSLSLAGAFSLAIGIAIQNFPEGAIISMPLKSKGISKKKAFASGVLSGIVEPISAFVTILLTDFIVVILPYLLSFAAGSMIFVVVEELIPESQKDKSSTLGTIGVTVGFLLMMVLDITLG